MTPFVARRVALAPMRRTWGQRLVITFNLVMVGLALLVAAGLSYGGHKAATISRIALDRSLSERPEAPPGSRVMNILLVGSDSSANLDPDDPVQFGRKGEQLGDVIMIAHLDERSGDVALLSLPRDLWVTLADSEQESRINRAFVVGGAPTLIDTIESNFDIPIHHYVNVDFAGFEALVEAIGSVNVFFETPARDWNVSAKPAPRSQTGFIVEQAGCHSLGPRQALAYVRSRYYQTQDVNGRWASDPTSDLGRIQRQQGFLKALLRTAINRGARNPLILASLVDIALDNVQIDHDLTAAELIDLSDSYRNFEPGQLSSYTYPAVDGTVGLNRVLLPRPDQAEALVELFNGAEFGSAESALVTIRHLDGQRDVRVRAVGQELRRSGFKISYEPTLKPLDPGVTIGYLGADNDLAELVTQAIGSKRITLMEQSWLPGRNIVVTVGPEPSESDDLPAPQRPTEIVDQANADRLSPELLAHGCG